MTNPFFDNFSDKRTVPYNVAGTGTVTTHDIGIEGVGTKFLTELKQGSYLVNFATNEAIKVVQVVSDTVAYLERAFSTYILPGAAPQIVSYLYANPAEISLTIKSANADGKINGASFSGTKNFIKQRDSSSGSDRLAPIIVDATGTVVEVEIIY